MTLSTTPSAGRVRANAATASSSFQYYVLANLVAGLLAGAIGAVVLRLARRRRPGMAATGPLRW